MTTTIRLPQDLIETIDGIVSSDYRYSNRSHLIECVLHGFLSDYDQNDDAEEADDVDLGETMEFDEPDDDLNG